MERAPFVSDRIHAALQAFAPAPDDRFDLQASDLPVLHELLA
jgi:hypothetical protein